MEKIIPSLTSKVAFLIMFMVDQYIPQHNSTYNADNIKKNERKMGNVKNAFSNTLNMHIIKLYFCAMIIITTTMSTTMK